MNQPISIEEQRLISAESLIAARLAGNAAAGSNQALERAIARVVAAGRSVSSEALALVRRNQSFEKSIGTEPCEWCAVSVAECYTFMIGDDEYGIAEARRAAQEKL